MQIYKINIFTILINKIKEKLITSEDPYHVHKSLGLICLLNYGIQYYLYFMYDKPILNLFTILPHILLQSSSFIFKVLDKKPIESRLSMFIWTELRLHSLIFTCRSCFCILLFYYRYNKIYYQLVTIIAMICADIVTNKYGTIGVSTVRGQHEKVGMCSIQKELTGAFFSISQMGATIITSGIFQSKISSILIYSTLPPIQTSAFGMTLIRKNFISHKHWSIIYSIELLFTYFIWYKEYKNLHFIPLSIFIYLLRRLKVSKYIIWSNLFMLNNLLYK